MSAVVRRGELTDRAWARIEPLLPVVDEHGRPWQAHRQVINGILWHVRTEASWQDLPERYGPWQTCHERFKRWEEVQVKDDSVGQVEMTVSIVTRNRGTTAGRSIRRDRRTGRRSDGPVAD
jgi:transposase